MIFAEWISDIVPQTDLLEIMQRFDFGNEQADELCSLVYTATRTLGSRSDEFVEQLRERKAAFEVALKHFRMMSRSPFYPNRSGGMTYRGPPPPPPPGESAVPAVPGQMTAETFEKMLLALIEHVDGPIRLSDAETADRKALGPNGNAERHPFWFALLVFWHHDLGRNLSVTNDSINGETRGPLVEFVEAMSIRYLPPNERSRKAIAKFVSRNKARVINDPNFGRMRFMDV